MCHPGGWHKAKHVNFTASRTAEGKTEQHVTRLLEWVCVGSMLADDMQYTQRGPRHMEPDSAGFC